MTGVPVAADAAGAAFDIAAARSDPRADRIRRLVAADGLAEASVAYAMTNTLAFLAGMDRGVPGSVGTEETDPQLGDAFALQLQRQPAQRRVRLAASHAFGFGGNNAVLLFGPAR